MELFWNTRQSLGIWVSVYYSSHSEQKWNMYLNGDNDILMGKLLNVKITNLSVNIKGYNQYQKRENNETQQKW